MGDFIKRNDQEFKAQATTVNTVVGAAATTYGQTAATMTAFSDLLGVYSTALEEHILAQEAAKAKTDAKALARAQLVEALRSLNRVAQAKVTITDEQLAE